MKAYLTKSLMVAASLTLAGAAFAQTTTAPAVGPDGKPVVIVPPAGMSGMTGMDGMSGMTGMAGTTAPQGMAGMDGMSGMSGMAATTEQQGMTGMDGMSGMTGMADTTGTATTTEQQGMDGMSGMQGMEGMAATEAPAAPADGVGTSYVKETHGDWTLRCMKTADGKDPCELYQLLKDKDGNSVAEISVLALPKGGQAVAGATVVTPLETSLLEQIAIKVDSNQQRLYPFAFCTVTGCVSRIGFTDAELNQLKRGNAATVAVAPIGAPNGEKVELKMSLAGFTAGYDAVTKANEGLQLN
ncbi:invasion associated locus B family protein [Paracoccus sp. p3-h83]|uniref:invasion associated locus B family protein n=1 Tax=Paracoccus sp. p3-h83 TaxID=3342805 RepID=UPI0035BA5B54